MNLISVPVAVYNGLFEWQLDLFWHRHKELYGKNAFQKAKAIVIRRNSSDSSIDIYYIICKKYY